MQWVLSKKSFIIGEAIRPIGLLRNGSNSVIEYSWDDVTEYSVLNLETQQEVPRRFGNVKEHSTLLSLAPGDSSGYVHPILQRNFGKGDFIGMFYLVPGRYAFCSKNLNSDTVYFDVEMPTNRADKLAWADLSHALDNPETTLRPAERFCSFFTAFVAKHDSSAYLPLALSQLAAMPVTMPNTCSPFSRHQYANRLVIEFPESPYAPSMLRRIDPSLLSTEQLRTLRTSVTAILESNLSEGLRVQGSRAIERIDSILGGGNRK
jgi:hypothetical protein